MIDFASAGAGVIGSIVNYISNERNNRLQTQLHYDDQRWQEDMAAQANQWSIEQWNRENAYNDPSAQMQRLQSAGINPALAYASGVFNQAATSPDVQMPQNGQAAHTMPYQMDPMLISNLQTAAVQRDLLRSEEAKNLADAELSKESIPVKQQELLNLRQQIEESSKRVEEIGERIKLLSEQEKTEVEKRITMRMDRLFRSEEISNESLRVAAYASGVKHQNDLNDAEKRILNRELQEMIWTFGWRAYGIRLGNQLSENTIAASEWRLRRLGIIFNPGDVYGSNASQISRFSFTIDPGSPADVYSGQVLTEADMFFQMIGQVFGGSVGLGFGFNSSHSYNHSVNSRRPIVGFKK